MKLLVISSILILSRTAGVTFGSNIRSSGAIGTADEEEQPQSRQSNRNLQNPFADSAKNDDGSSNGQGQPKPKKDVTVSMSSSKSEFAASESVAIDIKLTNTDAINPARILDWFNPCNGAGDAATSSSPVDMSFFNVETAFGGQSALYLGALIKRKEPTDKDYKTLKAGEQISCTINLDKYFQFSAPIGDDAYVISYAVTSMQLSEPFQIQGGSTMESLEAGALTVKVNARTIPTRSLRDQNIRGLQTGSTTFNKCTVAQQGLLIEARKQAKIESTNAVSTIANISQWGNATSCVRHNTWFGPYDSNRFAELKPGYDAISARLDDASIKFDCGCKQNYYAYVYPSKPYVIYLCKAFWSAPMNGTDSKMGTVIHEMSHFVTTGNTDDYAYGQSACKTLAIQNPQNAVNNADSHEYFAENTPKLACNPF